MQPKTPQRRSNFRKANRTMPRRRIDIALEALDYKNPDILRKLNLSSRAGAAAWGVRTGLV